MRKKKILFIMESLKIGGAEKSLLTLLSLLDYDRYEVELFLFSYDGELMEFIPKEVKLLSEDTKYKIFRKNRKMAPMNYLLNGDIKRAWRSLEYLVGCLKQRITKKPLYIGWNYVTHLFDQRELKADISIAYLERKCIYFNIDHVKSDRKIGFIHNDYSAYHFDDLLDRKYFKYYDKIATVSSHCEDVLKDIFPEYKEKFTVINNMVSSELIQSMAEEELPQNVYKGNAPVIVTVGRLVRQKGYDYAIEACKTLVDEGQKIVWYAIGEGPERAKLQEQINSLGLEKNFILVGAQKNPYKWMNFADVYVQPSRFEGFGITIAEANSLNKQIVCSDIPEFREQLGKRENCYFTDVKTMAKYIKYNIKTDSKGFITNIIDNQKNIEKFYSQLE